MGHELVVTTDETYGFGLHAYYVDDAIVKFFYTKSDDIMKQQCPSEKKLKTSSGKVKRLARLDIPDDFKVCLSLPLIVSLAIVVALAFAHRLPLSLIVSHSRSVARRLTLISTTNHITRYMGI
jgi:hypothetical protein